MSTDHHHPARKQALPLIIGLLFSALLAVVAVRCSSARYQTPSEATSAASQGDESKPPTSTTAATAPPSSAPAAQEPPVADSPTTIGRLMHATDEHDRSMLAEIERTTQQAPSASVLELLELRRAGKSRAELERFIQSKLEGGIPARLAAMKWLRATHGEPEPADDNEVMHAPGGPDELPRTVKPLTKKNP